MKLSHVKSEVRKATYKNRASGKITEYKIWVVRKGVDGRALQLINQLDRKATPRHGYRMSDPNLYIKGLAKAMYTISFGGKNFYPRDMGQIATIMRWA